MDQQEALQRLRVAYGRLTEPDADRSELLSEMAGIVHILRREGLVTAQISAATGISDRRLGELEVS